jgi:hypothetical protein
VLERVARGPPARTRGGRVANLIRLRYSLWTEQPLYNRRTFEPLKRRSVVLVSSCYRTALPWPIIVRACGDLRTLAEDDTLPSARA